MPSKFE